MKTVLMDSIDDTILSEKFSNFKDLQKIPLFNEYLTFLAENCEKNVVLHSIAVADYVHEFGINLIEKGYDFDLKTAVLGAILHDIGRSKSHSIDHGIIGSKILLKNKFNEKYAKIAERHIGAGISKKEAKKLNLPEKDYIPETLEEKVIANADNLISGYLRVDIDFVINKFKKRTNLEVVNKVYLLYLEINNLIN
ncbi:metal dependent phosphohydrolase [Methanococcus maripaludis C5]|uniref:Metal dependent phosphohydrolase n=1 Tax=Methanococcus maripaludis (strain C5 / ATCC BAA-1333) TaxID=402880 RepID=A4G0F6_METM5|nr:HDIG domain-containing metalloprotein [Methanococcus maripaludis]ABO35940.1 metal dependent phosphohydrolase [Methanococcus maripaludis C5]